MTVKKTLALIAKKLTKKNQTLGIAESCTGGLISSMVTEVPGASKYFYGGLVSYANHTKHDLLGVPNSVLKTRGAVSDETARHMCKSARKVFRADWALSVTGIAGPSGGTPQKPVGLVFYAVAGPKVVRVQKRIFKGTRRTIQKSAAKAALELLNRLLE